MLGTQPNCSGGQSDEGRIALGELVVSSGNAPKLFDAAKKAFDSVALSLSGLVVATPMHAIAPRWNDSLSVAVANKLHQLIRVVPLVSHNRPGINTYQQRLGLSDIAHLTTGENEAAQLPESLDQGVYLGAQTTTRATKGLWTVFFTAPAACWWARTMVASRYTWRKSLSLDSSMKTHCQTPLFDQRAKRTYTLFHSPKCSGKSRHGAPVRATHNTASTNRRLSAAVRPTSVALPGNNRSIRAHWALLSNRLIDSHAPSGSWEYILSLYVNRP